MVVSVRVRVRDIMEKIEIDNFINLPFGENVHQSAAISRNGDYADYEILSDNKELGYIDYLDLSEVATLLPEFFDVNCVAIAKEASLCSVALGSSLENALEKAMDCDPVSACNGTVGVTKEITIDVAKQLRAFKIKNVLTPRIEKEALAYLQKNNDINIIKINTPLQELLGFSAPDIKITPFGALVQEQNRSKLTKDTFKVVTKVKPTQQQAEDAVFAWKVSKHLRSKSAVIAKDLSTKAIIQGKTNGIATAELAADYACEASKDALLAVDGVIENKETINAAIQGRIGLIIEAGDGGMSDEIFKLADKYEISMIATKIRNNKY